MMVKNKSQKFLYMGSGCAIIIIVLIYLHYMESTVFSLGYDNVLYNATPFTLQTNQKITIVGTTFEYVGYKTLNDNTCNASNLNVPSYYHASEIKQFHIDMKNGQTMDSDICWPPAYNTVCNPKAGVDTCPVSPYNVAWFDKEKTMGVALCNQDSCHFGQALYLVSSAK